MGMKPPKPMFRERPALKLVSKQDGQRLDESTPDLSPYLDVSRHVICCPNNGHVEIETNHVLRALQDLGLRVDYHKGASAIDIARSYIASDYLVEGFESMLFVDSDMLFSPEDAVSLLLSDEPLIAGAYAAKKLGKGQINMVPEHSVSTISFGPETGGIYPVRSVGAGFMRIKMSCLATIKDRLNLPYCRVSDHHGWPFFLPVVVMEDDELRYLGEDYAFCWRARQAGIQPKIDTRFRVYHLGQYAFGLEEAAGQYIPRVKDIEFTYKHADPIQPTIITAT